MLDADTPGSVSVSPSRVRPTQCVFAAHRANTTGTTTTLPISSRPSDAAISSQWAIKMTDPTMREPGFYWVAVRIPNTPTEEISYLTIANYCEDGGWEAFESDGFALREEPSEFDYWIEQVYPPRLEPPAEIIYRLVKASRLKYP